MEFPPKLFAIISQNNFSSLNTNYHTHGFPIIQRATQDYYFYFQILLIKFLSQFSRFSPLVVKFSHTCMHFFWQHKNNNINLKQTQQIHSNFRGK